MEDVPKVEGIKDIRIIKGIGTKRAKLLEKLGITCIDGLLHHFPRKYVDRSNILKLNQLPSGEIITTKGEIMVVKEVKAPRHSILKALLKDRTGSAWAVWFNQPYLKKIFKPGEILVVTGKVELRMGQKEIQVVEYEVLADDNNNLHTGRIVPFYHSTAGLSQRFWRETILQALQDGSVLSFLHSSEIFSAEVRQRYHLASRLEAFKNIHFPQDSTALNKARQRLVFEELFLFQLAVRSLKQNMSKKAGITHLKDHPLADKFLNNLPFELTAAQKKVIREIKEDMESPWPMQRLLQGDVGAGKTLIAAYALLKAVGNGYLGVLMAPTEILAQQHYTTISKWFEKWGLEIDLLTGSKS